MPPDSVIVRLFGMTDEVWARHANPWSGWTRIATLPFLLAAIWSHSWIGWYAAVPIGVVGAWLWLNPRIFPEPDSTDSWISRAVLGERLWVDRSAMSIPQRHRVIPHMLATVAGVGGLLALVGAALNALWPTLLGAVLVYSGKMWFCDRMVWLYEDMRSGQASDRDPPPPGGAF